MTTPSHPVEPDLVDIQIHPSHGSPPPHQLAPSYIAMEDASSGEPDLLKVVIVDNKQKLSAVSSNASEQSTDSQDSSITNEEEEEDAEPWPYNHFAKNYITGLLTVFYAVILIIYAVVLELADWFTAEEDVQAKQTIVKNYTDFNYYMYITSFIFFAYWYILMLCKPRRWRLIQYIKRWWRKSENNNGMPEIEEKSFERINTMPNVGSLYLRLGAVVFAIVAIVYYAYSAYLHIFFETHILVLIFTIFQTHFLFCSSTMFDTRHHIISRFGAMHLVAANLINWFEFLIIKSQATSDSLGKVYKANKTMYAVMKDESDSSSESREDYDDAYAGNDTTLVRVARAAISAAVAKGNGSQYGGGGAMACEEVECYLGSFTKVFYTAVVEYSLIAAAVMFIVWQNIEKVQERQLVHRVHKKNTVRINCSKTIFGLFSGFGFLAGTFVSMALFYGYTNMSKYFDSVHVYNITDIVQHCIGIVACLFAFWRIRLLNYVHHEPHSNDAHHAAHANQELLDMILLAIGLLGELFFSISGLMGICTTKKLQYLGTTLLAAHISRIVQSILQCCLICIASKLKVSSRRKHEQPGKQTITFLIIVNIAIFIMNLFESDKVGTSEAVVNFYGKENWVFLVRTFSPLTIFFRFHSSVCLAEIWKSTYAASNKHQH